MTTTNTSYELHEEHNNHKQKAAKRRKRNIVAQKLRTPEFRMRVIDDEHKKSHMRPNRKQLLKEIESTYND